MGIALADAAADMGADVELVLGPVSIFPANTSVRVTKVTSAGAMAVECIALFPSCDMAVLAAAVADYTPVSVADNKMKKTDGEITLHLKPSPDIAATLGKMKRGSQLIAGFALETENEIKDRKSVV